MIHLINVLDGKGMTIYSGKYLWIEKNNEKGSPTIIKIALDMKVFS